MNPTPQSTPSAAPGNEERCIPITPGAVIPSSSWLWVPDGFFSTNNGTASPGWFKPKEFQFARAVAHSTHWHPDQPEAPTVRPADLAVKAGEVPEWAKRAAEDIGRYEADQWTRTHGCDVTFSSAALDAHIAIILKHAPSQPRQAGLEGLREALNRYEIAAIGVLDVLMEARDYLADLGWSNSGGTFLRDRIEAAQLAMRSLLQEPDALTPPPVAEPSAPEQAVEKCAEEIAATVHVYKSLDPKHCSDREAASEYNAEIDEDRKDTAAEILPILRRHLTPGSALGAAMEETQPCPDCGGVRPWCELADRIRNYLQSGGLFNPEMMEHQKVSDLLRDILAVIDASPPHGFVRAQELQAALEREQAFRRLWEQAATPTPPRSLAGDGARMDLLEKNAAEVRVEWDDGDGPIPPEWSISVRGTGIIGRGSSLRAACDAAMQPRSEPGAKGEREGES